MAIKEFVTFSVQTHIIKCSFSDTKCKKISQMKNICTLCYILYVVFYISFIIRAKSWLEIKIGPTNKQLLNSFFFKNQGTILCTLNDFMYICESALHEYVNKVTSTILDCVWWRHVGLAVDNSPGSASGPGAYLTERPRPGGSNVVKQRRCHI